MVAVRESSVKSKSCTYVRVSAVKSPTITYKQQALSIVYMPVLICLIRSYINCYGEHVKTLI